MENKNLIIIFLIVVIALAIACFAYLTYENSQIETKFVIDDKNISTNDSFKLKLVDEDNNPVANASITVSVAGEESSENYTLTTNKNGVATLTDKLSEGVYTIRASFNGGDGLKLSSFDNLTLNVYKKKAVTAKSSTSSSSKTYTTTTDSNGVHESYFTVSEGETGQYEGMEPGRYVEYWTEDGPIDTVKVD